MNAKILPLAALLFGALLVGGCSSPEADTPPVTGSSEQRTETATQKIANSNMTPEQKAAAIEYLKRGADGARHTEETARQMPKPPGS